MYSIPSTPDTLYTGDRSPGKMRPPLQWFLPLCCLQLDHILVAVRNIALFEGCWKKVLTWWWCDGTIYIKQYRILQSKYTPIASLIYIIL